MSLDNHKNAETLEKQIQEIERQLEELDKLETNDLGNINEKAQKVEALNIIKETIGELNEKDDLNNFRDNNKEEYDNMLLTIISWFNYLKKESQCYLEAKDIIHNFGEQNGKLKEWCDDLVSDETFPKNHQVKNMILNINESDTLIINDNIKIVVNLDEYKKYIKDYKLFHLRNIFYTYRIITDSEEYIITRGWKKNKLFKEENKPCPYLITVVIESTDTIEFSIIE